MLPQDVLTIQGRPHKMHRVHSLLPDVPAVTVPLSQYLHADIRAEGLAWEIRSPGDCTWLRRMGPFFLIQASSILVGKMIDKYRDFDIWEWHSKLNPKCRFSYTHFQFYLQILWFRSGVPQLFFLIH